MRQKWSYMYPRQINSFLSLSEGKPTTIDFENPCFMPFNLNVEQSGKQIHMSHFSHHDCEGLCPTVCSPLWEATWCVSSSEQLINELPIYLVSEQLQNTQQVVCSADKRPEATSHQSNCISRIGNCTCYGWWLITRWIERDVDLKLVK